ncbi:hypothetical protein GFK91_22400 [Roseibium aggregatum]|uniref:hypothetical protein n=1 Tax=Roseibium aggregatum TaxID=187304 RepID=UPI001E44C606|nr:hypothetical protein [Roseibium aggregatum]UES58123.1 hypothetical protein GFK91_22400 [Roseibium aggregatum]
MFHRFEAASTFWSDGLNQATAVAALRPARPELFLTKIILLLLFMIAAIQVIKPLGWPGLKKRSDAWKLVAGVVCVTFASVILGALFQGV